MRSLADLDARLAATDRGAAAGVLLARATEDVVHPLMAHLARRARAAGLLTLVGRASEGAPLWSEIAARLAIGQLDCEPSRCAEQIAGAANVRRAILLAPLPAEGSWDRAVAIELAALPSPPNVVFVVDASDPASDVRGERFDVSGTLDEADKKRWWSAVADEAHALVPTDDLGALEAWWGNVRRQPVEAKAPRELEVPEAGRALFTALALAARAWAARDVALLGGDAAAAAALVQAGAVLVDGGFLAVAPAWDARAAEARRDAGVEACLAVAHAIDGSPASAWGAARIAELLLRDPRALDAADQAHARALTLADDPSARREIVARWMREVDALGEAAQRTLRVRAAERALGAGEADEAYRWAQGAAALAPDDAHVVLLLGRASAALGDLVVARVALERAHRAAIDASDAALAAQVEVEIADVFYLTGDLPAARREAERAILGASDVATHLKARNTLGKILLAESKWDEADRHFAEDAMAAAAHRATTAGLRARLNRGIALLSKGLVDEARAIFQAILEDGERIGETRACAYALGNLAVVAMRRHEYGAALQLWERTIKLRHSLRDRVAMAHTLANLADLRLFLGLVDHAEHALSFGRRILGPGMSTARAVHFSVVAARIALARGNTLDAQREIARAIADGEPSGDRELVAEAYRVAVRIALEDGDVGRAGVALERAATLATKPEGLAEAALLRALVERALGKGESAHATHALGLARSAGNEAVVREAHALLADLHRAAGELALARGHAEQASILKDHIADALPSDVRAAFLARPDVAALARLQATLAERSAPLLEEAPPSRGPEARIANAAPREIVGNDPAVRGLLAAIRKVARANSTVLVRGESGTGKELVAEALHRASDRASGPLVTVNCAALVETLLLSELFGHEKGAFTGAFARRRGRFELAEGGTLFLDEIGDISPRTQVALLRVLQERTFERVGGTTSIRANVRIVCATHRDLRAMVERGEFREDLYYRLRGITLEVPPLRARMGDLPGIGDHLLARIAIERGEAKKTLSEGALDLLARHRWPGNVRELENALRAASLFAEGATISASDLLDNVDDLRPLAQPAPTRPSILPPPSAPPSALLSQADLDPLAPEEDDVEGAPLPSNEANATAVAYAQVRQGAVSLADMKRQIERDCIARALAETKGNITRAAALLGMKRPRLSQLVKQYGLAAVSSEAS